MNCQTIGFLHYLDYCFDAGIHRIERPNDVDTPKPCYRVFFMREGTLHLRINETERILTGANAFCLNEKDTLSIVSNYDTNFYLLALSPTVINGHLDCHTIETDTVRPEDRQDLYYFFPFIRAKEQPVRIFPLHSSEASDLERHFQSLCHLLNEQVDPNWPCRSRAYILMILFALSRTDESKQPYFLSDIPSNTCTPLVADVIHYLQMNFDSKITVDQLAAQFHTNRTTLLAEFRKSTGQSINRYLTRLRMTMAAALLRDTMLSMSEICDRTGFSDISYFSKAFKKEIRYSPSEYRRLSAS